MSEIKFHGETVHTNGQLPASGTQAPNFSLVTGKLSEKTLEDYKGKKVILNIFPSVNTGVCATSVRTFNQKAAGLENAVVLCISKDLPFAQAQFCAAEGIENVEMLSDFRSNFGNEYGVQMTDGLLKGLMSRAVLVLNPEGKITYQEQVDEVTNEPNYDAALAALAQ